VYARWIEDRLHKHFFSMRVKGEWFLLSETEVDDLLNLARRIRRTAPRNAARCFPHLPGPSGLRIAS
jgi:hypothetical protein